MEFRFSFSSVLKLICNVTAGCTWELCCWKGFYCSSLSDFFVTYQFWICFNWNFAGNDEWHECSFQKKHTWVGVVVVKVYSFVYVQGCILHFWAFVDISNTKDSCLGYFVFSYSWYFWYIDILALCTKIFKI